MHSVTNEEVGNRR